MPNMNEEELRTRSPAEQFENDAVLWHRSLTDPKQARQAAVLKRVFALMQHGGMQVTIDGETYKNPQDLIPIAAYLSHGQRLTIEIEPIQEGENPHQMWNWLTQGNPFSRDLVNKNMSKAKSSEEMLAENNNAFIFNRMGSSHDFEFIDEKIIETKLKWYDLRNIFKFIRNKFSGTSPNWGMNFNVGGTTPEHPNVDGTRGHFLLFYHPPTTKKPGIIMIGGESCEYGKKSALGHDHNFMGKKGEFSLTQGLKWSDKKFVERLKKSGLDSPYKFNGLKVTAPKSIDKLKEIENSPIDLNTLRQAPDNARKTRTPPPVSVAQMLTALNVDIQQAKQNKKTDKKKKEPMQITKIVQRKAFNPIDAEVDNNPRPRPRIKV